MRIIVFCAKKACERPQKQTISCHFDITYEICDYNYSVYLPPFTIRRRKNYKIL